MPKVPGFLIPVNVKVKLVLLVNKVLVKVLMRIVFVDDVPEHE